MKCWVVMYYHRFGTDAWPVFQSKRPTERQIIGSLNDWEGDFRDDEYIEVLGPITVPQQKPKRKNHASIPARQRKK